MGQNFDDRVEEEIRRRITRAASAAGVERGRIELEVLYLLPPEFVRVYRQIFDMALSDPISPQSDGGKDEGRVKASGRPSDPMRARSMGAAAGGGKKYVRGAWPVRSEAALEIKVRLDRKILAAVRESWETLVTRDTAIGAAEAGAKTVPIQCAECARFQKAEWLRCPYHP